MTFVVIDLIMNTFDITRTSFMNSKYQKFQFYKVTQYLHKKMTQNIMLEQFVFYLHPSIQFLTSN
jgi:hypothetical protein